MQLARLEIKGFKSFADRVTINFDEGITGIVGPNGCGKSNIVDSIRWVLGEQKSRVLRSEKMENMIFNGTKKRKPTQMAEVSLTFNNTKNLIPTEYSQVTITRKYFRSGESEYQLNGVPCRRKDITDLFLDTGIASNSYAIIELKMVDDLLNDKDNSRRMLFEEAAGISKFKIRKKQTLKKLEDTDADLDRVEDLLFEIDKNLKSLERQARQAKRYYEIKEEYKQSSIAYSQLAVKTQQEVFDNITSQVTKEEDHKNQLNTKLAGKEALLETVKADLIKKEQLLSVRQKALNEHVNKIRQYEGEKKIKSERKRFLDDRIEKLKEQLAQDKQSNERASFSIQSLQKEKTEAEKELKEIKLSLDNLFNEYQSQKEKTEAAQDELNKSNSEFLSKRETVFQHHKDLEVKEIQIQTLQRELDKTSVDSSSHSSSLEEFEIKIGELEKEKLSRQNNFEKVKLNQDRIDTDTEALQQKVGILKDELAQINRALDANQNEFNLTKSLVDNLEGFPEAIKFLKKQDRWKSAPLLSDIISCPESYRVCVENYLEPYMNYYVVKGMNDAYEAVQLLNESNRGKANFFVLDHLEKYSKSENGILSTATAATEIIDYDPQYANLINYLLGNVYIFEGKEAPEIDGKDIVLLEKSGKLQIKKFSISGGSVGLFEGKRIGRAKNLEKLSERLKALKSKQQNIDQELSKHTNELVVLKGQNQTIELENIKDEINQINESLVTLKTKKEQYSELISSAATKREDIVNQIDILNKQIESLTPQYKEEKEGLNQLENAVNSQKNTLEELTTILSEKSESYNSVNVSFHQKENAVGNIQQEISFKEEAFNSSLRRIEENNEELRATEHDINELVKKSVENDDELVKMYDEKETIEAGVNEAEKEYYHTRGTIDQEEKDIREVQRQREGVDQILLQWNEKLTETRIALNTIKERLSIEFNIDFDQMDPEVNQKYQKNSEEELQAIIEKLKNRMESMGPINPMAMEAYEEIKERFDFITGQKEDLLKAKEKLLDTIQEIDNVARETFMEAFDKIRDNFLKVFRTLFTEEDDCDLYLTNPEDPLESAIEITAKPKGKRPLTINQLSGGEKTLTAISLLFAIYLIKPAPFCIFDEVDAPLDDANIDKFNHIIREFSRDSQFILVTHNKRTMASTDIIYGITMIEQGISRVVPVDLRELA